MAQADRFSKERRLKRDRIYSGKIVELVVDTIEIDGREHLREVVRHPGGVVVLAELPDGRIPFVRQRRYPMDQVLLELPAGKIDGGESADTCAARELEEETGYRPLSLNLVSRFYSTPGFCDEILNFFHTDAVELTRPRHEAGEEIDIEYYTLDQALEMAARQEILDAKTLTALYWLHWKRGQ